MELCRMERIEQTDQPRGASVKLCLFVAGDTGPSARARRELERLRSELKAGGFSVEVVDVVARPDLAERAGILATPVLIRLAPLPRRGMIGDLSDWDVVADVLELRPGRVGPGKAIERGDD
jgi:circadian clock protein KaiB